MAPIDYSVEFFDAADHGFVAVPPIWLMMRPHYPFSRVQSSAFSFDAALFFCKCACACIDMERMKKFHVNK